MADPNSCKCNRWMVSLAKTFELDQFDNLYRRGVQCISEEEYSRIPQLRHREDALACLIGKLLLRHAAKKFTGCEWKDIKFEKTEKGKPYLASPAGTTFGLNITHQGDYVAFASSCSSKVGVDFMRLDTERNNQTADEYINSMASQASPEELRMMRSQPTEAMKMTVFYRYWCLKEAYLKATGEGILQDLSRVDFRVNPSDRYKHGCFVTSTYVNLDGEKQDGWIFEETFADLKHSAAVCKERKLPRTCIFKKDEDAKIFFSRVTLENLLEGAEIINSMQNNAEEAIEGFRQKPKRAF
ncbi:unnamed protein product, partial [Mesorhabditis spiculigera]